MNTYFAAVLCVIGLALGQIFFKLSASALSKGESFFDIKVLVSFFAAMLLYGITSIAWVWILQKIELGRVYPLMALAFVLVPVGSYYVFGERFHNQYFLGVAFIVLGIVVALRA